MAADGALGSGHTERGRGESPTLGRWRYRSAPGGRSHCVRACRRGAGPKESSPRDPACPPALRIGPRGGCRSIIQYAQCQSKSSALYYARTGGDPLPQRVSQRLFGAQDPALRRRRLRAAEENPNVFLREMLRDLAKDLARPEVEGIAKDMRPYDYVQVRQRASQGALLLSRLSSSPLPFLGSLHHFLRRTGPRCGQPLEHRPMLDRGFNLCWVFRTCRHTSPWASVGVLCHCMITVNAKHWCAVVPPPPCNKSPLQFPARGGSL